MKGDRIRRIVVIFVVIGLLLVPTLDGYAVTKRVQLVGDSWAAYMWQHKSLRNAFSAWGKGQYTEDGTNTTISGTTAAQWAANTGIITARLVANPTIDCVNLVIGGNDLWAWNTSWTTAQTNALYDQVQANIYTICQACLNVRPSIQVVLHGYDYINMWDCIVQDPTGPTATMWLLLGQPNPTQLNALFTGMDQRRIALTTYNSRIKFVQCNGVLQCFAGWSANQPGQAPSYSPFPGGNPTLPSPLDYFRIIHTNPTHRDGIHLTQDGYYKECWWVTGNFYLPWFTAHP